MQVYVELAVIENFCMDFTLLYAAKAVTKNAASKKRIAFAAALGACFAVVFPLFNLGAYLSVGVKILSGILLCLCACRTRKIKTFVKFTGAFLIFCAMLGGALIGVFSLTGLQYEQGGGFILSSVPVGVPLFCGLWVILLAKKLSARLAKTHKNAVNCRISVGQLSAEIKGFFDSGNKVYLSGAPVSVVPEAVARKILGDGRIKESVKIHTVAGSKNMEVFTADKVEIDFGDKQKTAYKVKIGVSPRRIDCAVLHCDLLED